MKTEFDVDGQRVRASVVGQPYFVLMVDDFLPRSLALAARETWPSPDWHGWHVYVGSHTKRTSRVPVDHLPADHKLAIAAITQLPRVCGEFWPDDDVWHDSSLYGAGLHSLAPGSALPRHLDAAAHPVHGWTRALTSILFLDAAPAGGVLELFDGDDHDPFMRIAPRFNRLVTFENTEAAQHAVTQQLICERRTLSLFWYSGRPASAERTAADFSVGVK